MRVEKEAQLPVPLVGAAARADECGVAEKAPQRGPAARARDAGAHEGNARGAEDDSSTEWTHPARDETSCRETSVMEKHVGEANRRTDTFE